MRTRLECHGAIQLPSILSWTQVTDGDGLNGFLPIRLHGIDAPEFDQPCGDKAKYFLIKLVGGKHCYITPITIDCYGRVVARVRVGRTDVCAKLVSMGYAWSCCDEYKKHEDEAKLRKRGLWRMKNPIAPWIWRKQKKELL